MKIETRHVGDVAIAVLGGRLRAGVGDIELRDLVDGLLAEGDRKILLDLSEVPSIDSSGVGELVASYKVAEKFDAKMKILQASDGVQHVLDTSRILPLFEVFDSEEDALASFGRQASSR